MIPLGSRLEKSGLIVEKVVAYGIRVNEIVDYSVRNKVDLIVMSSHRLNLRKPPFNWETISHKVSILSQCPVLLVK